MDTKEILGYAAGSIGSAVLAVIILPLLSWYFPADDIGRIVLMQTFCSKPCSCRRCCLPPR